MTTDISILVSLAIINIVLNPFIDATILFFLFELILKFIMKLQIIIIKKEKQQRFQPSELSNPNHQFQCYLYLPQTQALQSSAPILDRYDF